MSEKKFAPYYPIVYRAIQVILLVVILSTGFGRYVGIVSFGIWHLPVGAVTLILLLWMNYGRWNERILCGAVLVLVVAVVIPIICAGNIWLFWENYIGWCLAPMKLNLTYAPEYAIGYELMQLIWCVLLCCVLQALFEKYPLLKDLFVAAEVLWLLISMLCSLSVGHKAVVFTFGYVVLYYIERYEGKWRFREPNRGYVLWVLPFVVLYVLLLLKMPVSDKPYDWEEARNVYSNIKEKVIIMIENMRSSDREDFGMLMKEGFSGDGELGAGVFSEDSPMMEVRRIRGNSLSIYLRGKTYDSFNGRIWKQTGAEKSYNAHMDTLETLYALHRYDKKNLRRYIESNRLHIRYEYFHTGYMFVPAKSRTISGTEYVSQGSDFLLEKKKGYGTEYEVIYYDMNRNLPEFNTLLETDLEENQEIWDSVISNYKFKKNADYTLEDLRQYRASMKELYNAETELSEELEQYLTEITGQCTTDMERLYAIEAALNSYQYNRFSGEIPAYVDNATEFLDYFMLEKREGFCSYFATAFVLLARAEGFPARYVEGFCVPGSREEFSKVTDKMLHAWPEVYIEGIGWIPFEPTPGYQQQRYVDWPWIPASVIEADELVPETNEVVIVEEEEVPEEELVPKERNILPAVLNVFMIFIGVCAVLVPGEIRVVRRKYLSASLEQRFLVCVKRNLWIAALLGYKRESCETLEEFRIRICAEDTDFDEAQLSWSFLNAYQEYLYRDRAISETRLADVTEAGYLLGMRLRQKSKLQYFLVKLRSAIQWGCRM